MLHTDEKCCFIASFPAGKMGCIFLKLTVQHRQRECKALTSQAVLSWKNGTEAGSLYGVSKPRAGRGGKGLFPGRRGKLVRIFIRNKALARLLTNSDEIWAAALGCLKQGGIIAYPTEAVFGLGCDPDNEAALQRLLQLKQRPADKGLILVAASLEQLQPYLQLLAPEVLQRLQASWPGPVTWLCPARESVSSLLRGEHSSLAVRVSAHPVVQQLCRRYGKPVVSTSANLSGAPPATTGEEVRQALGDAVDFIVPGEVGGAARPSEIRDALTNVIIRPG